MGIRDCAFMCALGLVFLTASPVHAQSGWADEDEDVGKRRSSWGDDEEDEDADARSDESDEEQDEESNEDSDDDSDESSDEGDSDDDEETDEGDGDERDDSDDGDAFDPKEPPRWFFGAFTRMVAVPTFMLELFLDAAPGVVNASGGALVDYHTDTFIVEFGLGYTSYHFAGPYRAKGDPEQDTEYVDSTLGMVHLTGSMLWDAQFHKMFAVEYGFGLDLGVITGEMVRSEAYSTGGGNYKRCNGPLSPATISPSGEPYCEPTVSGGQTDGVNDMGAQYGVTEDSIPPVMLFPMIPHLALRFTPHRQVAIKLDFSYGIVQFTLGASAFVGFDL
jgi:hypothetical protein